MIWPVSGSSVQTKPGKCGCAGGSAREHGARAREQVLDAREVAAVAPPVLDARRVEAARAPLGLDLVERLQVARLRVLVGRRVHQPDEQLLGRVEAARVRRAASRPAAPR